MNELDDVWARMLDAAIQNAKASGRGDVGDYLALKRSNDLIRQASVTWLLDSVIEIAADGNRRNSAITIEREEPHEFTFQNATMAGTLVRIVNGVRRMTVEAGWTRMPSHGFMRNGALAAARITHFGMPRSGVELELRRAGEVPVWHSVDGKPFDSDTLLLHFSVFLKP
jgi:hypothetical protein